MTRLLKSSWLALLTACLTSFGCVQYDDGFDDQAEEGAQEEGVSGSYAGCGGVYANPKYDGSIIVADDNLDAVLILKGGYSQSWNLEADTLWRWNVSDAKMVNGSSAPAVFKTSFRKNKNDVKPVWYKNETHILVVTSAGNAVALIRLRDQRVAWWKALGKSSAHSAEMLPDGNVAIADAGGRVSVISTTSSKTVSCSLRDAHGVVWDDERQGLWALGSKNEMKFFEYGGTSSNPNLGCSSALTFSIRGGGHDLTPMLDGSRKLIFSAGDGILWFDTTPGREKSGNVSVHAANGKGIKGVSYNPQTGEYIFVQNEFDFRSDDVHSLSNGTRTLKGGKFYKAHWFYPNCFALPQR